MKKPLIIALDFPGKMEVNHFLKNFENEKLFLKIGMELFYQEGPAIVHDLKEQGHEIFLDLKLHDIPNTVKSAMKRLAGLGCDMVNVHAAGGKAMMEAAREGLEAGSSGKRPSCIAVTQLTSTSEQQMKSEQLIPASLNESVLHYANLAKAAGLDGVVCSSFEAREISSRIGSSFLTVTPGIRLSSDDSGDQKRVATPEFARNEGASAIVVGRSITRAENPFEKYIQCKQSWEGILNEA